MEPVSTAIIVLIAVAVGILTAVIVEWDSE